MLFLDEPNEQKPLHIDFLEKRLQFRLNRARHQGDPLLKAFGLKLGQSATIVDATAGLGQDAFLLAALGHHLILIERDQNVFALLDDALKRALADTRAYEVAARMQLHQGDAIKVLGMLSEPIDYLYLDPMFPDKRKSALSKQSMEQLKQFLETTEQPELLHVARNIAQKRVVVKRPKHAPFFANETPTFSHRYQSCRFDVYVY